MIKRHKQELVLQFGSKCCRCGYCSSLRALQFHHTDASEKDLYSKSGSVSRDEILKHPDRFLLLCANCHFEEHERIDSQTRLFHNCKHCGTPFRTKVARHRFGRGYYCSRVCQHKQRLIDSSSDFSKRFFAKTEQVGDCLIWTGYKQGGCGMMMVTKPDGRHAPRTARSIARFLATGEWSKYQASPTCGNRDCVNFKHLPTKPIG